MLKVAVITNYFPTSFEPWQGHSAYQTLRKLAELCDVHVFCPITTYPRLLQPRAKRHAIDFAWRPGDVDVTYVPFIAIPVISRPFNGFTMTRALLPHVKAFEPDILFSYVIYPPGLAAVRIGRELRVPSVLTAIGSDLNRISDPFSKTMVQSALREADFVTTVSHDLCATARRLGAPQDKTRAELNGCDTDIFHPCDRQEARRELQLPEDAEIVVYVGRLDLRKGLRELIEAISSLRERRPRLRCYIIGNGPARETLIDLIATHQIAEQVTLIPACPTATVALWMASANVVTLPSYNEGCPNVVIEALSSGRPMVATNVGGIPELMNASSGRLIPPRDSTALAEALHEVLAETWSPEAIAESYGRSWSDVADDLLQIFEELLGNKTAAWECTTTGEGADPKKPSTSPDRL